jgi:hypothetical protein
MERTAKRDSARISVRFRICPPREGTARPSWSRVSAYVKCTGSGRRRAVDPGSYGRRARPVSCFSLLDEGLTET